MTLLDEIYNEIRLIEGREYRAKANIIRINPKLYYEICGLSPKIATEKNFGGIPFLVTKKVKTFIVS